MHKNTYLNLVCNILLFDLLFGILNIMPVVCTIDCLTIFCYVFLALIIELPNIVATKSIWAISSILGLQFPVCVHFFFWGKRKQTNMHTLNYNWNEYRVLMVLPKPNRMLCMIFVFFLFARILQTIYICKKQI